MSLDYSMLFRDDAHFGRPCASSDARGAVVIVVDRSPWLRLLGAAFAVTVTSLAAVLVVV